MRSGAFRWVGALFLAVGCLTVSSPLASAKTESGPGFCGEPLLPIGEDAPRFDVRITVSRPVVWSGGRLRLRLENWGQTNVGYGYFYRLARLDHGSWVEQPTGPFFAPGLSLGSGTVSPCEDVEIADLASGKYRIEKKVGPRELAPIRAYFRIR